MSKKWFATGDEGFEKNEKMQEAREAQKERNVFRFWMKEGATTRIVFLDDDAFYCNVHNLKVGGKWGNYATCTKDFQVCPICEEGLFSTYTAHYSILDLTKYVNKRGEEVKYSKKLYPAKGVAIKRLHDLKKKYGSLVGRVFEITRYSANDPNCGGTIDYVGKVKDFEKKYTKDERSAYDYMELLAPPSAAEYAALGFESNMLGASDDEDIEEVEVDDIETEMEEEDIDVDEVPFEEDEEEKPKKKSKSKTKTKKKTTKKEPEVEVDEDEEDDLLEEL